MSVRGKFLFFTVAVVFIPFTVFGLISFNRQSGLLTAQTQQVQENTARLLADAVNAGSFEFVSEQIVWLSGLRDELRRLLDLLEDMGIGSKDDTVSLRMLRSRLSLDAFTVLDYDRDAPAWSTVKRAGRLFDIHGRSLLSHLQRDVFEEECFYFYLSNGAGREYLSAVRPSVSNQRHLLVLIYELTDLRREFALSQETMVESFNRLLESLNLEGGGDIALLDRNLRVLTLHTGTAGTVRDYALLDREIFEKAREEGTVQLSLCEPYPLLLQLSYVPSVQWYVLLATGQDYLNGIILKNVSSGLFLWVLVLVAALAGALSVAHGIVCPLRRTEQVLRESSESPLTSPESLIKLARKLPADGNGETAALGAVLAQFLNRLHLSIKDLLKSEAAQKRLEGESDAAAQLRSALLLSPAALNRDPRLMVQAALLPSRKMGGELYDVIYPEADEAVFLIGKVADQGVPAAFCMTLTLTLLRQSLRSGGPLSEAVTELNRQLCAQQSSLSVTLFVGLLNLNTLRLSYVNAGHSPALVAGKNGEPYALTARSGPAAGVFEKSEYSEYAAELKAGDSLWLYTEGVSGAQNANGELYGPERLKTLLSEGSSGDTLRALLSDVAAFRGGAEPADDLTVLTLRLL